MTCPPVFKATGSLQALRLHNDAPSCQCIESRGVQYRGANDLRRQFRIGLFNFFDRY